MQAIVNTNRSVRVIACSVLITVFISGCNTYAGKGATEGAAMGAASCAVGSLVGTLVFGGNAFDNAARSAVYCGAAGAFAGGVSGSKKDKQVQEAQKRDTDRLRQLLGPDAFSSLESLARCDYTTALIETGKAQQSSNPNYALSGLWLEVLAYADQRNEPKARGLFAKVTEQDWNIDTEAQAEAKMRESLSELTAARKKHGLEQVCA